MNRVGVKAPLRSEICYLAISTGPSTGKILFDAERRLWNSGTNWCVGSNSPCIGCAEPGFPWDLSPITKVAQLYAVTPPVWLPPVEPQPKSLSTALASGLGVVGGIAIGAAGLAIASHLAKPQCEKKD